jgi:transposase
MEAKRKVYTPEFKAQAVRLVTARKFSVAEAARRPGIHESRPHEWKKALLEDSADAFPGSGHQTPAEVELRQLRAYVKRLEMERDIPKRATAFFAALTK